MNVSNVLAKKGLYEGGQIQIFILHWCKASKILGSEKSLTVTS